MEGGQELGGVVATEKWEYSDFREYMLSLAKKGPDSFLPFESYPKKIALSNQWHELLDRMRKESKDGKERFALVGIKSDGSDLFFPESLVKGGSFKVSKEDQLEAWEKAEEVGIDSAVGAMAIHSHPNGWITKVLKLYGDPSRAFLKGHVWGFSPFDLFNVTGMDIFGLSESEGNVFALKSKDTSSTFQNLSITDYDSYMKYWNEKFGSRDIEIGGLKIIMPVGPKGLFVNPWTINKQIANGHKIALYKGAPGKDLVRVVPKQ